jgi:GMP synthase (glutamine-hydrolysing)
MAAAEKHSRIVILDFGSQYTQVIARRIRECQVYSQIVPFDTPASKVAALRPRGLILSGGPSSVYGKGAPHPDPAVFKLGIPVLGICYGLQLMAHFLGGKVEHGDRREFGPGQLHLKRKDCALFTGLGDHFDIWNSHGDKLTKLPRGFHVVGTSDNSPYAVIEQPQKKFYGLQFHPEVAHTPRGKEFLQNFVYNICGCGMDWTMGSFIEEACGRIREQIR